MKLAIVFCKNQSFTTGIYCKRALESLGHDVTYYDRKAWVIKKYDYVIKVDDGEFTGFKVAPWNKTVFWAIDTHTNMERLYKIVEKADYIFCAQKNGVTEFGLRNFVAKWLPLAGEVEGFSIKTRQLYDLAFVGGIDTEKRKKIQKLFEKSKYRTFIGRARREEIAAVYSDSYIGLNMLVDNDVNMRTFEVPINGGLLLMEAVDNNGLDELFIRNEEYVVYQESDDILSIVDDILMNKSVYEKVRQAGHRRAINDHTYYKRMAFMISQLD